MVHNGSDASGYQQLKVAQITMLACHLSDDSYSPKVKLLPLTIDQPVVVLLEVVQEHWTGAVIMFRCFTAHHQTATVV